MKTLLEVFELSLVHLFLFLAIPLATAVILSGLATLINRLYHRTPLEKPALYFFGPIGVAVHEFSHYFFCRLFFLNVKRVKWFDPKGRGGSHGAVEHEYDPVNPLHRFAHILIGFAPILVAPILVFFLGEILIADFTTAGQADQNFVRFLIAAKSAAFWKIVLFLYLSFAILTHVELSREDLKLAASGVLPVFVVMLILNSIAVFSAHALSTQFGTSINLQKYWPTQQAMLKIMSPIVSGWLSILILCTALSLLHLLIVWILTKLSHALRGTGSQR